VTVADPSDVIDSKHDPIADDGKGSDLSSGNVEGVVGARRDVGHDGTGVDTPSGGERQ
jgi:hypothetical protein